MFRVSVISILSLLDLFNVRWKYLVLVTVCFIFCHRKWNTIVSNIDINRFHLFVIKGKHLFIKKWRSLLILYQGSWKCIFASWNCHKTHHLCVRACINHSVVFDSCDPWAIACQCPLCMEFFWQKCWSRLPFSSSRVSSWPRNWTCISCVSCTAGSYLPAEPLGKPINGIEIFCNLLFLLNIMFLIFYMHL